MKKQLILLLLAFSTIGSLDAAAAYRFYSWCVNNRSRIAFATGTLLGSGATTYYWKNINQQPIYDRNSVYPIRSESKPEDFFPPIKSIRKEDIQIYGNEPGDKRTEHEKIREHLIREENKAKEKRHRHIEETLRRRSSSYNNCR